MYSIEHVIIHQTSATMCKAKHELNLAKWEKIITAWYVEQHEKIKKFYESNHLKFIMLNAWLINSELSKFFSNLKVTSLNNKIRYTVRN